MAASLVGAGEPPRAGAETDTTTFASNINLPVHRWWRYSAGYSAQWAETVIRAELADGGTVFDPFVGSGTTLIAAQAAGRESVGVESHPFVASVAHSKTCWDSSIHEFRAAAREVASQAQRHLPTAPPFESEPSLLQRCYSPESLQTLRSLQAAVDGSDASASTKALLWLALMSVLRPSSHAGTAQWQYVQPGKKKARVAEPAACLAAKCDDIASDMSTLQALCPFPPPTRIVEADIRALTAGVGRCDLVLTSPPYINNYDYADAARLEMTFLGQVESWADLRPMREVLLRSCTHQLGRFDSEAVIASDRLAPIRDHLAAVYADLAELRRDRGGRKNYHLMVVAYFHDMALALQAMRSSLAPGGTACLVVGDSAPYGVHVPVEEWLGRIGLATGFTEFSFDKVRDRNVKWKNRKHRVPLHEGRLWMR